MTNFFDESNNDFQYKSCFIFAVVNALDLITKCKKSMRDLLCICFTYAQKISTKIKKIK